MAIVSRESFDRADLESPKNTWLPNGHNGQRADLPVYLPGNGGLLARGFPKKGWAARWERLPPAFASGGPVLGGGSTGTQASYSVAVVICTPAVAVITVG